MYATRTTSCWVSSGPKAEAEQIKESLETFLSESRSSWSYPGRKTLITHATSQAAKFLGYELAEPAAPTTNSILSGT